MWACVDDQHATGTGLLAGWLHAAIVKIVTSYTRPGDRVLLLAPHAVPGDPTTGWPGAVACDTAPAATGSATPVRCTAGVRSRPGPLGGLHEAGWTVVRLGRDVVTRTVTTPASSLAPAAGPIPDIDPESGTGPGPAGRGRPEPDPAPVDPPATSAGTDPSGGPADRFDAIIATVDPSRTDWLDILDWPALLTPHGTLAAITHCDTTGGRLVDPTGPIVTALRDRRMAYHDHVVLLETPLSEITARPAGRDADGPPTPGVMTRPGRDRMLASAQTHANLLIFTRSTASDTASATSPHTGRHPMFDEFDASPLSPDGEPDRPHRAASVWASGQHDPHTQLAEGGYVTGTTADHGALPPATAAYAIAAYTRPGAVVLDPDCGAGTVLVEALRAGRHALGLTAGRRWRTLARANVGTAGHTRHRADPAATIRLRSGRLHDGRSGTSPSARPKSGACRAGVEQRANSQRHAADQPPQ